MRVGTYNKSWCDKLNKKELNAQIRNTNIE